MGPSTHDVRGTDLDRVLSIQVVRHVRNDGTVMHRRCLYQILETIRPRTVLVEERLNGHLVISHDGRRLKYQSIGATRPPAAARSVRRSRPTARSVSPAPDHPWRKQRAVLPNMD